MQYFCYFIIENWIEKHDVNFREFLWCVFNGRGSCNLAVSLPVKYSRNSLFSSRPITRRTVNRRKFLSDNSWLSLEVCHLKLKRLLFLLQLLLRVYSDSNIQNVETRNIECITLKKKNYAELMGSRIFKVSPRTIEQLEDKCGRVFLS